MVLAMDPIHALEALGQSVWLDDLDSELLATGELERLVARDGVHGVTSNPTIFAKAIDKSNAYDALIRSAAGAESDANVLERIMVHDLALACDRLRPVYDATAGADGFASIEVAPTIADDTAKQIEQAKRLWDAVDRPNLMVKIPGTDAGIPAIRSCLANGLNINVTLLFSVARYREVVEAFLSALEARIAAGHGVDRIASVASFFVSRVDTKIDELLDHLPRGSGLRGEIAIANAKLAYEEYERVVASPRWLRLAAQGARPQRLLWASTSPKNPRYRDTYYVDALVGPDTIDTMTRETLAAYLDHGHPEVRINRGLQTAHRHLEKLAALKIDLDAATDALETEGVASFTKSYDATLRAIAKKRYGFGAMASPPILWP